VSLHGHNLDFCGKLPKVVRREEPPVSKSWSALVLFDIAKGLRQSGCCGYLGTIFVMVIKVTMVDFVTNMTHVYNFFYDYLDTVIVMSTNVTTVVLVSKITSVFLVT
jgi:hypothetical protein